METLRIAILTETLPPARLRLQPWRYLGDLARELQTEGHDVSVVTRESDPDHWNGVRVEHHSTSADFRNAVGLGRLLDTGRFDAGLCRLTASLFFSMRRPPPKIASRAHLAGVFLRPIHSGWDLARRFLDPLLVPEIPFDRHHAALYASRKLGTWGDARSYFEEFVFLWGIDRQRAISSGLPAASSSMVPHPFDPFFLAREPAAMGNRLSDALAPFEPRVVFAGPPEESRGVTDVIHVMRHLPNDRPTQVVLLLRDPRWPEPLMTRTRVGPHEMLVVRGMISRDELRGIYQVSNVAVFPYRFVRTALPLVVLEAVAAGLPVVSTRVHPLVELEGRTGLVFAKPRDPRAIATEVHRSINEERGTEIRRRNELWIRSTPDWRAVARTYAAIFRRPRSV